MDPVGDEGPHVNMGLPHIMDCLSAACSVPEAIWSKPARKDIFFFLDA